MKDNVVMDFIQGGLSLQPQEGCMDNDFWPQFVWWFLLNETLSRTIPSLEQTRECSVEHCQYFPETLSLHHRNQNWSWRGLVGFLVIYWKIPLIIVFVCESIKFVFEVESQFGQVIEETSLVSLLQRYVIQVLLPR